MRWDTPIVIIVVLIILVGGVVFTLWWWRLADKWVSKEHRRFADPPPDARPRVVIRVGDEPGPGEDRKGL
jgi:hypothetical protein